MKCVIYQVRNTPPHSIIRELTTAHNIDRIRSLDKPGRLSFQLSLIEGTDDPGLITGSSAGFDADAFREGSAVIDRSTEGILPTLWFVQRIDVTDRGVVDVGCVEWRQLLFERLLPLRSPIGSRSAAATATELLRAANARNPTYIRPLTPESGLLKMLPAKRIEFGGMAVGRAFDEMRKHTNSEWWIDYQIDWKHCIPKLRWAYRRGSDRRNQVHLIEGVYLTSMSYSRDARQVPRIVRFIQGGGQSPADTPNATIATTNTAAVKGRSLDTGQFQQVAETDKRRYEAMQGGPATQTEINRVLPQGADNTALSVAALRTAQIPIQALIGAEIVVRRPKDVMDVSGSAFMEPSAPWSSFDLGDTIKVRLTSPDFGNGADIDVRVMAMQPDEDAGELMLAVEVQQ